jgi:hypothetical protein
MGAVNSMLSPGHLWLVRWFVALSLSQPPKAETGKVPESLRQDGAERFDRASSARMIPKSGPFMFPVLRCQGMERPWRALNLMIFDGMPAETLERYLRCPADGGFTCE